MKRIEALGMAIAHAYNALDPSSEACRTLNPGLLRLSIATKQPVFPTNENGVRIYTSFQGGFRALIVNLTAKCLGETHAHGEEGRLSPDSPLADLCKTFPFVNVRNVTEFLQDTLDDSAITARTPIAFFLQDNP